LILSKLQEISPFLKKGAMVTDVGSAKFEIVKAAEKIMPKGVFFVGGHPMAGKEESGIEAAEAGLFENRPYILTPTARTSKKALEQISAFVSALGVNLLELDPRTHDLVVAAVSHLPLAAAAGVVDAVLKKKEIEAEIKKCASSGFRDTTRVASGDPQLGRDIFLSNRKPVLVLIRELVRSLKTLEKLIRAADGEQILLWLKQAKEFRDSSLKTLRE
jgi:prephenate dehydrogenase